MENIHVEVFFFCLCSAAVVVGGAKKRRTREETERVEIWKFLSSLRRQRNFSSLLPLLVRLMFKVVRDITTVQWYGGLFYICCLAFVSPLGIFPIFFFISFRFKQFTCMTEQKPQENQLCFMSSSSHKWEFFFSCFGSRPMPDVRLLKVVSPSRLSSNGLRRWSLHLMGIRLVF